MKSAADRVEDHLNRWELDFQADIDVCALAMLNEHEVDVRADERQKLLAPLRELAREILERSTEANGKHGEEYESLKLKIAALGIDLAQVVEKLGGGT